MKGKTTYFLVKELEKLRGIRSRNSYFRAWCGFVVSIVWLARLYMLTIEEAPIQNPQWLLTFLFVAALVLCLQSFYIIIRHIMNKKLAIIIEALLENKKEG